MRDAVSNQSEDEKFLEEVESLLNAADDDLDLSNVAIVRLVELSRDGLKWRKAAAARDEFTAAWAGFGTFSGAQSVSLECALKAAAAWRAAHGDDVDALKARVAELEDKIGTAYQIVGNLVADDTFADDDEEIIRALDFLSSDMAADEFGAWPRKPLKRRAGSDVEKLEARIAELEKEKREAFDLGFKAAGGKITPLDHLLPSRMNQ